MVLIFYTFLIFFLIQCVIFALCLTVTVFEFIGVYLKHTYLSM